jgi:von Willebrand factor type A domain
MIHRATIHVMFTSFAIAAVGAASCGGTKGAAPGGFGDDGSGGSSGGSASSDDGGESFSPDAGNLSNLFGGGDAAVSTGAPLGDAGCATAMSQVQRSAVYLLFVLDGSGSMKQENKWTAVVPALTDIFSQMSTDADPGLAAGLVIFSDTLDATKGAGPYPASADVPMAFVSSAQNTALDQRLMAQPGGGGGTPTETALTGSYGALETFQPKAPLTAGGKKVLVLITDGAPTDGCNVVSSTVNGYTSNDCVVLAGQKLKEASPKGPIETFVVGVGDFPSAAAITFDPSFLGYVAQAGGTGPANCNPSENSSTSDLCYFEIDPSKAASASDLQQEFEKALNTIRGEVVSCNFPIQTSGLGTIDPTKVNVEIGGKTVLQDPTNGWTYDSPQSPTEIILHGAACAQAKGNLTEKVSVVLGCQTQVVPK